MISKHDPGGLVRTKISSDVLGTALFGGLNDCYRYRLGRTWSDDSRALFVCMNPSTADPFVDDPTVAKCQRFAKRWGYGGIDVVNTFAYRVTDQGRLTEISDPIGPDNDDHILALAQEAAVVILAYGKPKRMALRSRGPAVAKMLLDYGIEPFVLRLSKDGTPWHPLYLPENLVPIPLTQA